MTISLTNANVTIYETGETAGNNIWLERLNSALEYYDRQALKHFTVAVSDETTDLTTGTGKITFRMPYKMELNSDGIRASVGTAPAGSTIIVDVNESGSTILSTKLTIDAGEKTSTTAATAAVISDTTLADDAEITIDIDQVGSSTAGKGLKITFIGKIVA